MKAIAFAMREEADGLLLKSRTKRLIRVGISEIQVCEIEGKEYILLLTGIGKVNAASAVTALYILMKEDIDELVNAGIGGSLSHDVPLFSLAVSSSCLQHDVDTSPIGDPLGFVSGVNKIYFESDDALAAKLMKAAKKANRQVERGIIASGDQFIADSEQKLRITQLFHPISVDMESAAMAQVAYSYGLPYAAIRLISDLSDNGEDYIKNKPTASALLTEVLVNYILDE